LAVVGKASIFITTVSFDTGQTPLEIVHVRVSEEPTVKPVIPEVAPPGVVTVDAPDITAQTPDPVIGVFPANVEEVTLQSVWSAPADAAVGNELLLMITSSKDAVQAPLLIVHRKVDEKPTDNPVIPEVAEAGVVITAEPELTVHKPVPIPATLPANVAEVTLHSVWSVPASATVGGVLIITTTVSLEAGHTPFDITHSSFAVSPTTNPVNVDVRDVGVVIVATPETNAQVAVPVTAKLAARVVVVTLHKVWSGPALAVVGNLFTLIVISSVLMQ
jgi:hypothetical protein